MRKAHISCNNKLGPVVQEAMLGGLVIGTRPRGLRPTPPRLVTDLTLGVGAPSTVEGRIAPGDRADALFCVSYLSVAVYFNRARADGAYAGVACTPLGVAATVHPNVERTGCTYERALSLALVVNKPGEGNGCLPLPALCRADDAIQPGSSRFIFSVPRNEQN